MIQLSVKCGHIPISGPHMLSCLSEAMDYDIKVWIMLLTILCRKTHLYILLFISDCSFLDYSLDNP